MQKRSDRFFFLAGLLLYLGMGISTSYAQTIPERLDLAEPKSPRGAFFRSVVMPGWGHHYADRTDWNRGRVHLGADVVLLAAVLGYNGHYRNTREAMFTAARSHAGVDVKGRSKSFQLAVAQFNSLADYNLYMEQTRNWDKFLDNTSENQWEWPDEATRRRFDNLRGKSEDARRQIPMLLGLMGLNRVVSGISSAVRVRNNNRNIPSVSFVPVMDSGVRGAEARFNIRF